MIKIKNYHVLDETKYDYYNITINNNKNFKALASDEISKCNIFK